MKGYFLIILFFGQLCFAQSGFNIPNDERKITIPFQLINNLIFIPVEINGVPLTFLLDTGVGQTLLISKGTTDVSFTNQEKMQFSGLGGNVKVEGLKSKNNMVKITDQFIDYQHTIFIILEEIFNLSEYVGIPVHGIMGFDFFQNHPIEIDYLTEKITVYNNEKYYQRKTKKFKEISISVEGKKPYLESDVIFDKEKNTAKLLIDTGNSDAVWLFPTKIENFPTNKPSIVDFLGRGFNGDIFGRRSRIKSIFLKDFQLDQPITSMPDSISIQHLEMTNDRKGSIGSEIMRRFDVIFDYPNKKLLLKKNKYYEDPFRFNMSGLDFKHVGLTFEKEYFRIVDPKTTNSPSSEIQIGFTDVLYNIVLKPIFAISSVRIDSPAYKAGLKKEDVLQTINGKSTSFTTLSELNEMMKLEEGKSFKFKILRGGFPMEFTFTLKDPIPYQN